MKTQTVTIRPPYITLDSLLKFAGAVGTGGEAKLHIQDGKVLVNGEICTQRGKKLYPGDEICFFDLKLVIQ